MRATNRQTHATHSNTHKSRPKKLKRNKRSSRIIHVTLRPTTSTYSSSSFKTPITTYNQDRIKQSSKPTKSITSSDNLVQVIKTDCSSLPKLGDQWPDWTSFENHHRKQPMKKRKKRCLRLSAAIIALFCVFLLAIITTVLILLLNKSEKTKRDAFLRWNQTGITVAGIPGQSGTTANTLKVPTGVTVDWSYSIYVADTNNNRIQYYSRGSSSGTTVCGQSNGIVGSDAFHLNCPWKVMIDSNHSIYVVDRCNHRIQLYKANSSSGLTIAGQGGLGNNGNQLNTPEDVILDEKSGSMYIADTYNHRIMLYPSGLLSGTVVAGGNGGGIGKTKLYYPTGVRLDSSKSILFIVNYGSNIMVQWKIGDNQWTYFTGNINGYAGNTSTEFSGPECLVDDPMGNFYVADKRNNRIQFFPFNQSNGITIAGRTGISGTNSTLLNQPFDVALDNQLNLYVADTYNYRIQKFLRY